MDNRVNPPEDSPLDRTSTAILSLAAPFIILIASLPMALGKVPPNHYYGFRTAATLSDPVLWYRANRILGIDSIIACVLSIPSSLLIRKYFRGQNEIALNVVIFLLLFMLAVLAAAAQLAFMV